MLDIFNIIGIGQCGCRIAKEFNRVGFNACYINSDTVDMRDFNVPESKVLMLASTGSGRSPAKGRSILEKNFGKFSAFIDQHLDAQNMNVFIIGLGGGTGGGQERDEALHDGELRAAGPAHGAFHVLHAAQHVALLRARFPGLGHHALQLASPHLTYRQRR
jgi:hypothetical protein